MPFCLLPGELNQTLNNGSLWYANQSSATALQSPTAMGLPQDSHFSAFQTRTPVLQILNDRYTIRSPNDHPDSLFISVIHFLVLPVRWDQRPVSWLQILSHIAEGTVLGLAGGGDEGAVATDGIDDGVLSAMVVDCGGGVRMCAHQSTADGWGELDDGRLR